MAPPESSRSGGPSSLHLDDFPVLWRWSTALHSGQRQQRWQSERLRRQWSLVGHEGRDRRRIRFRKRRQWKKTAVASAVEAMGPMARTWMVLLFAANTAAYWCRGVETYVFE